MKVTFKQLKIKSFKSIDDLVIDFDNDTVIKGANEVGKTTIADAISYCLTGKSSEGNATFGIIPVGMEGKVSPAVQLEVEMKHGDDVRVATIARMYQAKLNKAKEFTGDYSNVCFINGVKTGVREFDSWIDSHICKKEIFNLLFDVKYFTENIPTTGKERPWEAQRRLLLSISPLESDYTLASSSDEYSSIAEELKRYDNGTQLLQALKTQLSAINKELDGFDIKVDALESAKLDIDAEEAYKQIEDIRSKMVALNAEKEAIKEKMESIPINADKEQSEAMRMKLKDLNLKLVESTMRLSKGRSKCDEAKKELNELLEKFKGIKSTCYACGQDLPEKQVEQQKKEIKAKGVEKREELKKLTALLAKVEKQDEELRANIAALENDIEMLSTSSINPEYEELQKRFNEIDADFSPLGFDLATAQGKIAQIERNDSIEQQIIDLEAKHSEDMNTVVEVSMKIDECRNFISEKCRRAEESINSLFDGVTFKMFRQNKSNDDIKECCDIFWNGVPYSDLSYSTKFIVSLKIVKAFQSHYNVFLPILIDNAESIDWNNDAEGLQTIRLVKEEQPCPRCGGSTGRRETDGMWTCSKCGHRYQKKIIIG